MIVVGTWRYDEENGVDSGRVRVYLIDESQSDWIQTGINILDPTPSNPATINAGPIVTFTPIHHGGVDDKQSSERGYVKVYRTIGNDGEDRVQLGQTICEDAPGDQFGQSVDIAADGNTLVIGSSGHWEDND